MQDHAEQKKQLRARLRQLRERMDEQMRQQAVTRINDGLKRELDRLRLNPDRQMSGSLMIFSYLSYGSEASTAFLFEEGWKKGDVMLAPKVLADPPRMELRRVRGPQDIEPGIWGIPEPKASCEVLPPEHWPDIDLVLVPGLGYDLDGGRIGYGGGYYDRFAERLDQYCAKQGKRPLMAALVLPGQLEPNIPMDPLDLRLDLLITPEGIVHIE
ncbi:5-formyltetrahydrofolate cyclo-ligase [Paenibacillus silvae]|uniref:5-formyltetrahydrofolate cyclo-ligase n=1 Tax=Paenibacillus silvae TaxID=1325358 RepID=UPI0025A13A71|nr:5-formyltetrahydrofolate cyclo-ligase [Paenibacillus silvae]MDM5279354.1 5-formyltetrahydrofolate cyclo-ligase [Paenibacillus silvae]